MNDALKNTESVISEPPAETDRIESRNTDPDPTCCRAPGEPDGGPDT